MKNKILSLFTYNKKLKFNEIEKDIGERSNKLAYHVKGLVNSGIISKTNDDYSLSQDSETLIPYLSDKKEVIPVILVHIGTKNKAFLYERDKRPFKGFLSLPGGRLIVGESISESVRRIMKEKHNIDAKLSKVNSISLEHVKKDEKIIHSFLLIYVSAKTKDKIDFVDINKNKFKIITSDYRLMNNKSNLKVKIDTIFTKRY